MYESRIKYVCKYFKSGFLYTIYGMYQTIFRPREFRIQWLKPEPQVDMINSESIGFHPVDLWIIVNDMLMQI